MYKNKPKLYIVLGPTASGKSDYAVKLAKKINGEIISTDSRQIYKYLDIGSGKITKKEMKGVRHYALNIIDPIKVSKNYLKTNQNFPVTKYLKFANSAVKEIRKKNKIPILCGGTGLYIDAILYGLPKNAKVNSLLRKDLEKENIEKLLSRIQKLNKDKYKELINNPNSSERNNKRRLIRIIEILENKKTLGENIEIKKLNQVPKYDTEFIFIDRDKEELRERITRRLEKRLLAKGKNNLINEVKYLINTLKIPIT